MDSDSALGHQEPGHLPGPHKSCTGNTLTRQHPSLNQSADMLPEDDVTISQTDPNERQNRANLHSVCLMIGPFQYLISQSLKFQGAVHFREREQRVRIYQTPLESNFSKHPCSFQPPNSPAVNAELQQILRFNDSFLIRRLRSISASRSSWKRLGS
jgi:hypothetical protein